MISCISPNGGSCEHTLNTLRYADRVKSLSKGNNPKKDLSTSTSNLRESTSVPLSSTLPNISTMESTRFDSANITNKFGWSKQVETEIPSAFNMERSSSGREDVPLTSSYSNYFREQGHSFAPEDVLEDDSEQDRRSWRKGNTETYSAAGFEDKPRRIDAPTKLKNVPDFGSRSLHSDDDLNALLKEEEDLVISHRNQVEYTINIVREEMKLLDEADQPGNQLDDYISKLNTILSQKAAGIVNLQAKLANFQRRLTEHNVLVSSMKQ